MNLEDLKSAAKSGDIESQYQLGKCYLEGSSGLRKNRKYYETWLDKAAIGGHQRAAEELAEYYGNKSIKTTYSPTLQLKYLKLTGKFISEEQLINLGDPITCKTKAESLLFGDSTHVDFEKAKLCLLKSHLDSETLKNWADKYLALHCNDSLEVDNIVYLYLLAANQDMNLLNDYISSLYESESQSPIHKMIIYRLLNREKGTTQMIVSRIYCLLEGFGTKKNTRMAAKLYVHLSKEDQENLIAFQSTQSSGLHFSMPKSEIVEKEHSKFNRSKRKKNLHNFLSNNLLIIIFFPITIPYKAIFYLIPKGLLPKEIKMIGWIFLIASLYTGYKAYNDIPYMTLCTVLLILLGIMIYFSSYKGGKTCPKCRKHNSMSDYKKISEGGMQYHCVRTCSKCGYKETSDSFYDDGDGCR